MSLRDMGFSEDPQEAAQQLAEERDLIFGTGRRIHNILILPQPEVVVDEVGETSPVPAGTRPHEHSYGIGPGHPFYRK